MRQFIGLIVFIFLVVVAGCTPSTKISSDQVKAFVKEVNNTNSFVKHVDVKFRPTQIEIIYTLNENIDEVDRLELFTNARELVNSKDFEQEVIQGQFLKKYDAGGYPNITILFDMNDDGEYDVQYTSIYQEDELNTANESLYSMWYYHPDMGATGELVP
jgi:hypothetical protein